MTDSIHLDTDKVFCRILAQVMAEHGVKKVICSPGSRNVPMLMAIDANESLEATTVIDERCAAFMAVGIAQTTQRPVALVCTSGTALLNYAPAVAEAYYQGLPLIVISADRPVQWLDQDDSQTIAQNEALRRFVKQSYDIPTVAKPDTELTWYVNRIANDAMIEACSRRKGPVHINLRIAPPLGTTSCSPLTPQRIIELTTSDGALSRDQIRMLADEAEGKRILLIAGFLPPDDKLNKAVARFASLPDVAVMAETVSNLHLPAECYMVDSVLSVMDENMREKLKPDLVITIGGALVSRMIKDWMRSSHPSMHWTLGFNHTTVDSLQSLTRRIEAPAAPVIAHLATELFRRKPKHTTDYKRIWSECRSNALNSAKCYTLSTPWSELKALSMLIPAIPRNSNLFLSNGTTIRYSQIISESIPHACFCNRGVSGIDGSTSTAVGASFTYRDITLLITGDMSLAYDLGGLAIQDIPPTMRIVVVNNKGGGIFRFIGAGHPGMRERMLCADPHISIMKLADTFGWNYLKAENEKELTKAIPILFSDRMTKTILEISVPGVESAEILRGYMKRANK